MSTTDTILSVYENMKQILANIDTGTLWAAREKADAPKLGVIQFAVLYKGSEFEQSLGFRPAYENAQFDVGVKFMDATQDGLTEKLVAALFALKEGITPEALNVGNLQVSQYVTRVTFLKPVVDTIAPNVTLTVTIMVRLREG